MCVVICVHARLPGKAGWGLLSAWLYAWPCALRCLRDYLSGCLRGTCGGRVSRGCPCALHVHVRSVCVRVSVRPAMLAGGCSLRGCTHGRVRCAVCVTIWVAVCVVRVAVEYLVAVCVPRQNLVSSSAI